MKVQFIVTVEGEWHHNGKPVTAAIIERELREAARDKFDFLASSVTVKRAAPSSAASEGDRND